MSEHLSFNFEPRLRPRAIPAAATGTAGFVGACRTGPLRGPAVLVTSYEELQALFGGIEPLRIGSVTVPCYLAHAARAFFDNGGRRLYVARVFRPRAGDPFAGVARSEPVFPPGLGETCEAPSSVPSFRYPRTARSAGPRFIARYPGADSNVPVRVRASRGSNVLFRGRIVGLKSGDLVEVGDTIKPFEVTAEGPASLEDLAVVHLDALGNPTLVEPSGATLSLSSLTVAQRVTLTVEVGRRAGRVETYSGLSTAPSSPSYIGTVLAREIPEGPAARDLSWSVPRDPSRVHFGFDDPASPGLDPRRFADLARALLAKGQFVLSGGNDGQVPLAADYRGSGSGPDATGLAALDAADIPIIAAPGSSCLGDPCTRREIREELVAHCERARFRLALLSAPPGSSVREVESIRAEHASPNAALVHPPVTLFNPFRIDGEIVSLPPEGAIAGILARVELQRGLHADPSGEPVTGVLGIESEIEPSHLAALASEGVTCLGQSREGAVALVAGRTSSADPTERDLTVRRLAMHLASSIQKGTRWVLFEPNNEALWQRIKASVDAFLHKAWQRGHLQGASPEEAYRVRCDRSTMSSASMAGGKLVILAEIAPVAPGQFILLRVEQWTASAGGK